MISEMAVVGVLNEVAGQGVPAFLTNESCRIGDEDRALYKFLAMRVQKWREDPPETEDKQLEMMMLTVLMVIRMYEKEREIQTEIREINNIIAAATNQPLLFSKQVCKQVCNIVSCTGPKIALGA